MKTRENIEAHRKTEENMRKQRKTEETGENTGKQGKT